MSAKCRVDSIYPTFCWFFNGFIKTQNFHTHYTAVLTVLNNFGVFKFNFSHAFPFYFCTSNVLSLIKHLFRCCLCLFWKPLRPFDHGNKKTKDIFKGYNFHIYVHLRKKVHRGHILVIRVSTKLSFDTWIKTNWINMDIFQKAEKFSRDIYREYDVLSRGFPFVFILYIVIKIVRPWCAWDFVYYNQLVILISVSVHRRNKGMYVRHKMNIVNIKKWRDRKNHFHFPYKMLFLVLSLFVSVCLP